MEILIKAAQLILSLSILVVLHELGHFIPAKLFKTRVEKFYLFFDPWFSLFKIKRGGTEYGIGWLPLGGYVKISGMIDESMDKEQMKLPPQDWEFRSKPAWQRLIIMVGGVTVNVILGIVIYAGVLFCWGEEFLPNKNVSNGIACDSTALKLGFQNGDKIISVDNKVIEDFSKIVPEILFEQAHSVQVDRGGSPVTIPLDENSMATIIQGQGRMFFPRQPFEIEVVKGKSIAEQAGLMKGDKVTGMDSATINYYDEFQTQVKLNKGKKVSLGILRNGVPKNIELTIPTEGIIGLAPKGLDAYYEFQKREYSFFQAIPGGFTKAWNTIDNYIKQFKLIFSPKTKAYESVGGFITLGKIFSPYWDWEHFWLTTAFLSMVLAFMNLLPIPALDGGHVMFLLYEVITRRKPNEKVMEYAQYVGMILLLGLLLFANGNDIFRLFK